MDKVQNFVDDELNSTPGCTVKFIGWLFLACCSQVN